MTVHRSWRIGQDNNTYDEIADGEYIRQINRLTEEIGPELVPDTQLQAIADAYHQWKTEGMTHERFAMTVDGIFMAAARRGRR